MGFQNDITGENGSLIRAQIKSPNFNQAAQTGWAILRDGRAFFFEVTAYGEVVVQSGGQQIFIGLLGGTPIEYFVSGVGVQNSAAFQMLPQTISDRLVLKSSEPATPYNDYVAINLQSSATDGTTNAQLYDSYVDTAGVAHTFWSMSLAGVTETAVITAPQPGTGGGRGNVAVAETWHNGTLVGVFGNPSSPFVQPRYRLEPQGGGKVVRLSGATTLTAANSTFAPIFNLPSGYVPTVNQHFVCSVKLSGGSSTSNYINVNAGTGAVQLVNAQATGDTVFLDGITLVTD